MQPGGRKEEGDDLSSGLIPPSQLSDLTSTCSTARSSPQSPHFRLRRPVSASPNHSLWLWRRQPLRQPSSIRHFVQHKRSQVTEPDAVVSVSIRTLISAMGGSRKPRAVSCERPRVLRLQIMMTTLAPYITPTRCLGFSCHVHALVNALPCQCGSEGCRREARWTRRQCWKARVVHSIVSGSGRARISQEFKRIPDL